MAWAARPSPTSQLWRGPNYTTEASLVAVTLASYRCTFARRVLTNPACGVRLFQVRFAPDSDRMRITSPQGIALAPIWVQTYSVEYKGIRYSIRTRIVRH